MHYVGRDTLLITSSDAVVSVGGRIGTLHEFTIAVETDTPIGFLQGAGGVSTQVKELIELAHPIRTGAMIAYNTDADKLIKQLTDHLDILHAKYHNLYQ